MGDKKKPASNDRGEMETLIRQYDWRTTTLGDSADWPSTLRVTLSIVLNLGCPAALYWGPENIFFYNDAYRLLFAGNQHPGIPGKPGRDGCGPLWEQFIYRNIDYTITSGKATNTEDELISVQHEGFTRDFYFTCSFSPVQDEQGSISGVLMTGFKTSKEVVSLQNVDQHQAMREQPEERQQNIHELRDTVPAMMFSLDMEQRYLSYNKTFLEWFHVADPEEPLGKTVREFIGEEAYQRALPHLETAYAGNESKYEVIAPTRLDPDRWLSIVYSPVKNQAGMVTGVIVLATDVTRIKRAELAVKRSETRLRTLLQEAPVAATLFRGPEMIIEIANDLTLEYWGKTADIIGKPLAEAAPELETQQQIELLKAVYASGGIHHFADVPIKFFKNGVLTEGSYSHTLKALEGPDGKTESILAIGVDVTAQAEARKALEVARAALEGAIELAALGTWSLELRTKRLEYSPRMREWFGFTKDQLVTLDNFYNVIKESDRSSFDEAVKHSVAKGSTGVFDSEYSVINIRTGIEHIIHAQGKTIFDEGGTALSITGTAEDITIYRKLQASLEAEVMSRTEELNAAVEELSATNEELEQLNEQLNRSNSELAQYAYVASHDLQEPLRKIRIFSGILGSREKLSPEGAETLSRISVAAERMTQLIQDLLSFSRLLGMETSFTRVLLNEIAGRVLGDFDLLIKEKSAVITIGSLPVIDGVELQMYQLITNLIANALKFTVAGRSPVITVAASSISAEAAEKLISKTFADIVYYEIVIADNGIGFDKEYSDQIFEIFRRLQSREHYPGSGIGLSLCRRIVSNHSGYLFAESVPGEGSSFHVILPARQVHNRSF